MKDELAYQGLPESIDAAKRLNVLSEWAQACVTGIDKHKKAMKAAREHSLRMEEAEREARIYEQWGRYAEGFPWTSM